MEVVRRNPDTDLDPDTEILHTWSYRILTQVVEQEPDTEALHKWSFRIIRAVQKDPHTELRLQIACGFTFASRMCTLTHTVWGLLTA